MIVQGISLFGALLILLAFGLQQRGTWAPDARVYLWCNFIGGGILATVAWIGSQWGFLLMESVWTLVSLHSLLRRQPASA
ncbi:MAG: CBU_0592 family membrane protein [Stenotrophobium sp.]